MFGALKDACIRLLAPRSGGPTGQEVAVTSFALAQADAAVCRKLCMGEELTLLRSGDGLPAVMRRGKTVGSVPDDEGPHMARLLAQGARLSCRVVKLGQDGVVRVRVSIVLTVKG